MISLPVIHRDVGEEERRFETRRFSGKFVDAELEREFDDRWSHDTQQRASRIALIGGLLLLVPGLAFDLWASRGTGQTWLIMAVRLATTAPLVGYGWASRSWHRLVDEPFNHKIPVLLEGLLLFGFVDVIYLRPEPIAAETATFCVLVLALHLMAPNRVMLLAPVTTVACIAFEYVRLTGTGPSALESSVELLTVVVTLACGIFFNRELEEIRREEFVALTIATDYSDRLERAMQRSRDLENELRDQANLDPLTGLHNRRWLFREFDREFARARRTRQPLSVMILDADRFKRINDTYGHGCGDEVLCTLAKVLLETVRSTDSLARIGGEEFAVLMPETDARAAGELAERVRTRVAETVVRAEGHEIHVTISCGVTACLVDTEQPSQALARADGGLYDAKHRGRDLVVTR